MRKQLSGIERLPKKVRLPKPRITLVGCISMAEVFPQNDEEAFKWYRKAAEQGYSAAQDNLNWMYQKW